MNQHPIPIAVAMIWKGDQILLGRRPDKYENGLYGFPGGKQNYGERIQNTLIREVKEETGLTVGEYYFKSIIDEIVPFGHFFAVLFEVRSFQGNLINTEPTKCASWEWHYCWKLPTDQTALLKLCIENHIL